MGPSFFPGYLHHIEDGCPQIFPGQNEIGQEDQAEQTHPPVGEDEDWKHHQIQCQEASLALDQAEDVNLLFVQKIAGWQTLILQLSNQPYSNMPELGFSIENYSSDGQ